MAGNSMLMKATLRKFLNKDMALNSYVPLIPASVVVHETLTIVLLCLLFLANPFYFRSDDDSRVRFWSKAVLAFAILWIAIIAVHGIYIVGSDPATLVSKGYRQAILICLAPIIFDYVKCTLHDVRLDPARMFRTFHTALFLFVSSKLIYVAVIRVGASEPITSLYDLIGPGSGFFLGNQNHSDDYAMIIIIASIWISLFSLKTSNAGRKIQFYFAPILTSAFFLNSIVFSGNRGGWVGFSAAAVFLFLTLIHMKKLKLVLPILIITLIGIFVHIERIESEVTKNWYTLAKLIGLPAETKPEKPSIQEVAYRCSDGKANANDFYMITNHNTYLRLQIIPFAIDVWLASPWLGYGVYDKNHLAGRHQSKDRCVALFMSHPHNIVLHQAIIGGVPFAILVVGMVLFPAGAFIFQLIWLKRVVPLLLPPATYSVYLFVENLFNHSLSNMDLAVLTTLMLITSISLAITFSTDEETGSLDLGP